MLLINVNGNTVEIENAETLPASDISVITDNFDGNLSGASTDVQSALEEIDDLVLGGGIAFATVTDLNLSLSDFNGGLGVYFEGDEDVAVTVNNDLKDGIARYINVINTHASAIISVTLPAPRIYVNDVSAIPVLAGCQIQIQFYWDSAQSAFVYLDSVNMKKVLA